MTLKQLRNTLAKTENVEIEYKSAKGGLPGSLWESVSAFANTNGGVIVLGVVEKKDGAPVLDGLTEEQVREYKKHFWDNANNRQKLSCCFFGESDVREVQIGDDWVLVIEVMRVEYNLRPIYLNGNPLGNTYKRNHEGDYRCTDDEVKQMFSDANHLINPADSRILCNYSMEDIDSSTLKKYRIDYDRRHEKHPWSQLSDEKFLEKIGAYRKDRKTGEEGFTVAGMLMFGKTESITDQECLPYYFVDYRERLSDDPNVRWTDRIYPDGRWSANLYEFYNRVLDKLYEALPKPFRLAEDGKTRLEYTSAHISVREALANTLIHAAYTQNGSITVDRWKKRIELSNPGTMLISVDQFFHGQQSVCRNPLLQNMFMLLGIGEKAGSGADIIVKGWKDNKWVLPRIEEKIRPDRVVMTLEPEDNDEASSNVPSEGPSNVLSNMLDWQHIIAVLIPSEGPSKGPSKAPSSDQVNLFVHLLDTGSSASELRESLGYNNHTKFKDNYLQPLIDKGVIEMTQPDKPKSPTQKYRLTAKGRSLLDNATKKP